jgi:hypothetical protein
VVSEGQLCRKMVKSILLGVPFNLMNEQRREAKLILEEPLELTSGKTSLVVDNGNLM